jgi:hypothetical protein
MTLGTRDFGLFDKVDAFARRTGWLHTPMYDIATYGVVVFAVLLVAGWWFDFPRHLRRGFGMNLGVPGVLAGVDAHEFRRGGGLVV